MGKYINLGNNSFASALNGLYIDKSGLIGVINSTLHSERRFCCVTRSRRFGKSLAAKMLAAYYDCSCDSHELFANMEIAKNPTFEQHINKYNVIYLDMTSFVTRFHDDDIVGQIEKALKEEILEIFPDVAVKEYDDLMDCLIRITAATMTTS